jgi:putative AlgH/UPF0301 family transcriptional regulator
MARGPWDSDDDVFYGYSNEDLEESNNNFSANPPPSPSAKLDASTSTGVGRRHSSMLWNASLSSLALFFLCIEGGCSFNPRHIRNSHRPSSFFSPTSFRKRSRSQPSPLLFAKPENVDPDTDDWRDFRAKLVSKESNLSPDNLTPTASNSSGWAYDAGYLIERGSLVISNVETTLGCHDLNQPYFHKAVVLLLDHDDTEFTKGILLNRPTDLQLSDEDIFYLDDDGTEEEADTHEPNTWQMNFGGDIAGLYDEKPMIVCLHNVTRYKASDDGDDDMNDVVMKDVRVTSHHAARALVASGEASPEDFHVFFGFSGWDPGMLHEEIKRGSWTMVAANAPTIWNELQAQRSETNLAQAGFKMWHNLMEKIGKGNQDELGNELTHDNYFSDLMLKEWVTEMCLIARDDNEEEDEDEEEWIEKQNNMENVVEDATDDDENDDSSSMDEKIFRALEAAQGGPIELGMIIRGSSLQPSPYMLYNHALHKSTVVVFQDEEDFSVGLILNIPSNETYFLKGSDGKHIAEMNIRYGGPSSAVDDNDDESKDSPQSLIWLHCNQALQDLRIGAPLQKDQLAGIWTCTESHALQAIESGHASPADFMLVKGLIEWGKEGGAGGVRGEVFEGNMEIVPTEPIPDIWQLLMSQTQLSLETLDNNVQLSHNAWNLAKKDNAKVIESRHVIGSQVDVSQIGDDAMRIWQVIFLLPFKDRKLFSKLTKDRYKLK